MDAVLYNSHEPTKHLCPQDCIPLLSSLSAESGRALLAANLQPWPGLGMGSTRVSGFMRLFQAPGKLERTAVG